MKEASKLRPARKGRKTRADVGAFKGASGPMGSEMAPVTIVMFMLGRVGTVFGGKREAWRPKTFARDHRTVRQRPRPDPGLPPTVYRSHSTEPHDSPSAPYGTSGAALPSPPPLAATASSDSCRETVSFLWAFTCFTSFSRRSPMEARYRSTVFKASASHL